MPRTGLLKHKSADLDRHTAVIPIFTHGRSSAYPSSIHKNTDVGSCCCAQTWVHPIVIHKETGEIQFHT
jgi:hypothetical protein